MYSDKLMPCRRCGEKACIFGRYEKNSEGLRVLAQIIMCDCWEIIFFGTQEAAMAAWNEIMIATEKLEPCYICGCNSKKLYADVYGDTKGSPHYVVACGECGNQEVEPYATIREAVASWNAEARMFIRDKLENLFYGGKMEHAEFMDKLGQLYQQEKMEREGKRNV